jgi:DNA-binding beta-propeller fold protein YncE
MILGLFRSLSKIVLILRPCYRTCRDRLEEALALISMTEASRTEGSLDPSLQADAPQRHPWRGVAALIAAAALVIVAVSRILSSTIGSSQPLYQRPLPPAASGTQPSPFAGASARVLASAVPIGAAAGLSAPQEAVQLPNGRFAVVDTGNRRLVILDSRGRLLHSSSTHLEEPYAIAARRTALYVLDSRVPAVERFDLNGRYLGRIVQGVDLAGGRGMGITPAGTLYVANPVLNSVVVVSPAGRVVQLVSSPLSDRPGEFNQPSDVAVGPGGTIFVVDNVNSRIEEIGPHGEFLGAWSVPSSNTSISVHVLPLADGRVLASDPAGSLLIFQLGGSATRVELQVHGHPLADISPLGVAPGHNGTIVVTDNRGGRLLLVKLPARRGAAHR